MLAIAIPFFIILVIVCVSLRWDYNKINQQAIEATDSEEKFLLEKKAKSARNNYYFYLVPAVLIGALTADFKVDQKEVDKLANQINTKWWAKNRNKPVK